MTTLWIANPDGSGATAVPVPGTPVAVGLATATNWPDALAGGAFVGAEHVPLLLAAQFNVPQPVATWLSGHAPGSPR